MSLYWITLETKDVLQCVDKLPREAHLRILPDKFERWKSHMSEKKTKEPKESVQVMLASTQDGHDNVRKEKDTAYWLCVLYHALFIDSTYCGSYLLNMANLLKIWWIKTYSFLDSKGKEFCNDRTGPWSLSCGPTRCNLKTQRGQEFMESTWFRKSRKYPGQSRTLARIRDYKLE